MMRGAVVALALGYLLVGASTSSCFLWTPDGVPEPPEGWRERVPERTERPAGDPRSAAAEDLVEIDPASIAGFDDDLDRASLTTAVERNLEVLARRPADALVTLGDATCATFQLRAALESLRRALLRGVHPSRHLDGRFRVYRSQGRPNGSLVTGYYEPVIEGRRRREPPFVHPLFGAPDDLLDVQLRDGSAGPVRIAGRVNAGRLESYYSRREIDGEGALDGRGLELVWLADPVARFFLHVQGSGVIRFEDGTSVRVGFAGSNGRRYTSIGRLLLADGSLSASEASAPGIQSYLRRHPERRDAILFANERYIFFRELADGPLGSIGAKLTAGRSIAVDPAHYPEGTIAHLDTRVPVLDGAGRAVGERPLRRFVVAQDAGAAITGPGRVDLFFGTGEHAGLEAGHMAAPARLHLLFPDCP